MQRIIWQTHEWEYSDLPKNFLATSLTWKNINQEWEYRYVSAANRSLDIKNFDTELYRLYSFCSPITQADIWRYVCLYKNGGVYADMDSICNMPLEYLLEKEYQGEEFMATERDSNGYINNANFMVVKNSKILSSLIEIIKDKYRNTKYYPLFNEATSKDHFWDLLKTSLAISPVEYTQALDLYPNSINLNFKAAIHDEMFKKSFNMDYLINYYGTNTYYSELVKINNWTTHIPRFEKFPR
jgi:mannosyltransferase OCH1-like enzyme